MGNTKDSSPGAMESREPSRAIAVQGDSSGKDLRPEPSGASGQEGPRHEPLPKTEPSGLALCPSSAGRRPRSRQGSYRVEVVRLDKHPTNRENPYASLSASERYECFVKRLAEIWSAIGLRQGTLVQKNAVKIAAVRKVAA